MGPTLSILLVCFVAIAAIYTLFILLSKSEYDILLDKMYKNNDISEAIYKKYKYSKKLK